MNEKVSRLLRKTKHSSKVARKTLASMPVKRRTLILKALRDNLSLRDI